MGRFGSKYIDELLAGDDYQQLVEISAIFCGSSRFVRSAADYGLPARAFMYVETLFWFAQAIRSGVWTYYEATPALRQDQMLAALREHAPSGFAEQYQKGMMFWQDEAKMLEVDEWIEDNDGLANDWLRQILLQNREMVRQLTG